MESGGFSYGIYYKKCIVGLVQCQIPGCNHCLHIMCQSDFMKFFNMSRDVVDLKLFFDWLGKESRKEERSEDVNISTVPLNTETDIMINSDSLEKIQDMSMYSAPFNVEAYIDSFEYSNERKEERSVDVSVSSAPLNMETYIIINSDNEKKKREVKMQM